MSIVFSCDLRQGCFVSGRCWAEIKCVHPGKFLCLSWLHQLTDRVALYRSFRKYLSSHIFLMLIRANPLTVQSPVLYNIPDRNMWHVIWWCDGALWQHSFTHVRISHTTHTLLSVFFTSFLYLKCLNIIIDKETRHAASHLSLIWIK